MGVAEKEYRLASRSGDVVRMKCGVTAVVTGYDFLCGGHFKQLTLRPKCSKIQHLWLFLRGKLRPVDEEINELVKIGEVPVP